MAVQASAKGITVSAKKLKLIVDMVRGKKVEEALTVLKYYPSPSAREVAKVVKAAAANAENNMLLNPKGYVSLVSMPTKALRSSGLGPKRAAEWRA